MGTTSAAILPKMEKNELSVTGIPVTLEKNRCGVFSYE